MRNKLLLFFVCASVLMLNNDTMCGQQGVLAPKKQTQVVNDEKLKPDDGSQNGGQVITPRRGSETQPNYPTPFNISHIQGPPDVNVAFGAGESSVISRDSVEWPATSGSLIRYESPRSTYPSILLGSDWSANAVIALADNKGLITGEVFDIKAYYSTGDTYATAIWTPYSQINSYVKPASVQIYGATLPYDENTDFFSKANLTQNYSLWDAWYAMNYMVNGAALNRPASPPSDSLQNLPQSDQAIFRTTGTANPYVAYIGSVWGSIYYPFRVSSPSTPFSTQTNYNYYSLFYWHLSPWYLPVNTINFTGTEAASLYTSTRDINLLDDGQPLIVRMNTNNTTDAQFAAELVNHKYVRPTTLLLNSQNTVDSIAVGDVEWFAIQMKSQQRGTDSEKIWSWITNPNTGNPISCAHFNGYYSYQRFNYDFIETPIPSYKYVDAAIRLLDTVDLRVRNNVVDLTYYPFSINTDGESTTQPTPVPNATTDALFILPGKDNTNNFRVKVDGNISINLTQEPGDYDPLPATLNYDPFTVGNTPLYDGWFYKSHVNGDPSSLEYPFPTAQATDIWLGSGTSPISLDREVWGLDYTYGHPREGDDYLVTSNTLTEYEWVPFASTYGSVFGVNGLYYPGNTGAGSILPNMHTRSEDPTTATAADSTSIIEIGTITNNQDLFHIYSGGMLKNYRAGNVFASVLNVGSITDGTAPNFYLSHDEMPLYIINDGDGNKGRGAPCGGINFNYPSGIKSINDAIAGATGMGDLHIQSLGYVHFKDDTPPAPLNFIVAKDDGTPYMDNSIKILSDSSFIEIDNDFFFRSDSAHLTIWAKGKGDAEPRGATGLDCNSGVVWFHGEVDLEFFDINAGTSGNGLVYIRSEYDDVFFDQGFRFKNEVGNYESGELMIQAGHDIRVHGGVDVTHEGPHSLLFEAKKTAYFKELFKIHMGSNPAGLMDNGSLIVKAGYTDFHGDSHAEDMITWDVPDYCYLPGYENRYTHNTVPGEHTGGDIWFGGDVELNFEPIISSDVNLFIRAYNSIYFDGNVLHNLSPKGVVRSDAIDTTLTYAETGNVEAMKMPNLISSTDSVRFAFDKLDYVYFLLQAGNGLGEPCAPSACNIYDGEWNGNILFGPNKTFTINHDGRGPTLISAARDIENQEGANFTFNYTNEHLGLSLGSAVENSDMLITAGRHIETHAPYLFNFVEAGYNITNDITMRAGHLADGCDWTLCKVAEIPSNITFNFPPPQGGYTKTWGSPSQSKFNEFSEGGAGNGSILLFASATFDYVGKGDILMDARNGNIESDPYLHGTYGTQAPIVFNHFNSPGMVTMEAIDIKLHDILSYNTIDAAQPHNIENGQFRMHAYDSILTRNLSYENVMDSGSVFITSDKWKSNKCDANIHQGHIVLGYGADCTNDNVNDQILFDFDKNPNTVGANLLIRAGYLGYTYNRVTGRTANLFDITRPQDRGKGFGGNITFDFLKINMGLGDGTKGGYAEISTPNGNIWGKDSIQYHGINGNLVIDAGVGSLEDTARAVLWRGFGNNTLDILNTSVPLSCGDELEWRTGNIMLKGGSIDFIDNMPAGTGAPGNGNATFRTREGYIDIYDRFNASNMTGHLLFYAGLDNVNTMPNQWGDVSLRDFQYTPVVNSGSVFFGADDNIMLNYGYNNGNEWAYQYSANNPDMYDVMVDLVKQTGNPYYTNGYGVGPQCYSTFNVNKNGYLWYRNNDLWHNYHLMYRGCESKIASQNSSCSPNSGECETIDNGARPLTFNFYKTAANLDVKSGGLAVVASNFIDVFTKFTFYGGTGSGIAPAPGTGTLKGENVLGFGLYMKSTFEGITPAEMRRNTCFTCGSDDPTQAEWPYIAFHDDAYIYPQNQKALIESPVVEFFGHADLDVEYMKGPNSYLSLKSDSLIFHDSVIFDGTDLRFNIFTEDAYMRKINAMRLGVVNDLDGKYYQPYGSAIEMEDHRMPVLELGFQRCSTPPTTSHFAPNRLSMSGGEPTPEVGGDIIVAFKNNLTMPIFNTIVANHARISFVHDKFDVVKGQQWGHSYLRTDLLRIRNKVEFYTDPHDMFSRNGTLKMSSDQQIYTLRESGMFPRHVHLEPGSELSIPGEDSLLIIATTTIGGYGEAHENVYVQANGIIAPGYASLMECDCQSGCKQGSMKIHNLYMEKDAEMRISIASETDTLIVQDSVFFWGKIKLHVLQDTSYVKPGCYLFMVYNDLVYSTEYIKNLELQETSMSGSIWRLDYLTHPGRVYLCVADAPPPTIQRFVNIHAIEGVTTDPVSEILHYVGGHQNFVFTATYKDKSVDPFQVYGIGYTTHRKMVLNPTIVAEGTYEYTIRQVTEPWDVYFDPEVRVDALTGDPVGNDGLLGQRVWAFKNTLFMNVAKADVASIYHITGVLYQKVELSAGLNKLTLDKGVYMVTLSDGVVYKIIIN